MLTNQTNDRSTTEEKNKFSAKSDFGQMFQASREFHPSRMNPIDKSMTFTDGAERTGQQNKNRMHNSKNEGQTH